MRFLASILAVGLLEVVSSEKNSTHRTQELELELD
jgi:hypothetical protein